MGDEQDMPSARTAHVLSTLKVFSHESDGLFSLAKSYLAPASLRTPEVAIVTYKCVA